LLRVWKTVPFPRFMRRAYIELTHPRFLVGVVAYICNSSDEVLLFHHTYRRRNSWSLPGGYVEWSESPQDGIAREVLEESGLVIRAGRTLAAAFHSPEQLDLLIECEIVSGTPFPSPEVDNWRYVPRVELSTILPNHRTLLREAKLID
jgi:8-oxo-dGTP pyrophosphatase MutT (NUDIX family)